MTLNLPAHHCKFTWVTRRSLINWNSGGDSGTLPPNEKNQVKWWGQRSFKNTLPIDLSESGSKFREVSMPPRESDYSQLKVAPVLIKDVESAKQTTFGSKGKSWELEQHRICW